MDLNPFLPESMFDSNAFINMWFILHFVLKVNLEAYKDSFLGDLVVPVTRRHDFNISEIDGITPRKLPPPPPPPLPPVKVSQSYLKLLIRRWNVIPNYRLSRTVYQILCCGYSSEPSLWDDSDEYPQHRVWKRIDGFRMPSCPIIWSCDFCIMWTPLSATIVFKGVKIVFFDNGV